ncbi:MAG: hypothetical protein PsegKO_11000 [Pseudohongiellaceae bacterium]|jgi:arachidonate 15-lipoxygenase
MTRSKNSGDGGPNLSLPQNCNQQQRDARQNEVKVACEEYQFNHDWTGYPPLPEKVPKRETTWAEIAEMEAGFAMGIAASYAKQKFRYVEYEAEHLGKDKPPFSMYEALYDSSDPPIIARNDSWQQDSVFALQQLQGMFPWFIQRVVNLDKFLETFPVQEQAIANLLPPNETLASLADAGKLYYTSQSVLEGAKATHDHVMTAPTTLFFVNIQGQLMPLGIQLYPVPAAGNPIFTPNDNQNTWLGVKIHAGCADALVYSLYSHVVLLHFVMCSVWTAANRTLPVEHPIYALLKPHFWMTLYATNQVKGSMDKDDSAQLEIMGIDITGQNMMVSRMYEKFDFGAYNPAVDLSNRGVDDEEKLPHFLYRDDMLRLWSVDYDYVESMMQLFYSSDSDIVNDYELQAWMAELASKDGAGLVGLPINQDGHIATRQDLYELLTSVLLTVTSRHSSIVVSALHYGYVPANPYIYRLAAPQDSRVALDLKTVSDCLPPISKAMGGRDLLAAAAHFLPVEMNSLGNYPEGFTDDWPAGAAENIQKWQAALDQVSEEINARNKRLEYPYVALDPKNTFNSIFN